MSDDRRTFQAKTDQMFAVFFDQIDDITKVYQIKVASALIRSTYGPGNQWHATPYIATGRLRAGWRWADNEPPPRAAVTEAGPFDPDGLATIGSLSLKILQTDMPPVVWFWNTVGYAWLVHEGKGGHKDIGPRPWVEIESARAQEHLAAARRDVMSQSR